MLETFQKAIAEGKLSIDSEGETVVPAAFERIPETWVRLFDGSSTGKLITNISRYVGVALRQIASTNHIHMQCASC